MGTEIAQEREWSHERSLDWHLAEQPLRAGLGKFLEELGALYRDSSCFWRKDDQPEGFRWIDCEDRENSVFSYLRLDGAEHVVVVCNLTPVVHEGYRIGVPDAADLFLWLSSDDSRFGGSGVSCAARVATESVPWHGFAQSVRLTLPPLAALVLGRRKHPADR
jgi:1,4-alpha-glucan branching enzyme